MLGACLLSDNTIIPTANTILEVRNYECTHLIRLHIKFQTLHGLQGHVRWIKIIVNSNKINLKCMWKTFFYNLSNFIKKNRNITTKSIYLNMCGLICMDEHARRWVFKWWTSLRQWRFTCREECWDLSTKKTNINMLRYWMLFVLQKYS